MTELKDFVGGTCPASLNRRMRTRTYDGVGAAVSNGRGYPIYPIFGQRLTTNIAIDVNSSSSE